MPTRNKSLGSEGEHLAALYLVEKGYHIIACNWQNSHQEIDIIADWYGETVFVEVKTRSGEKFHTALEAVDKEKQKNLRAAAEAYMRAYADGLPYRFDVITLVGEPPNFELRHHENAF